MKTPSIVDRTDWPGAVLESGDAAGPIALLYASRVSGVWMFRIDDPSQPVTRDPAPNNPVESLAAIRAAARFATRVRPPALNSFVLSFPHGAPQIPRSAALAVHVCDRYVVAEWIDNPDNAPIVFVLARPGDTKAALGALAIGGDAVSRIITTPPALARRDSLIRVLRGAGLRAVAAGGE